MAQPLLISLTLGLLACTASPGVGDSGRGDGGGDGGDTDDGATADGGGDSGITDSGTTDSGATDSGATDSGGTDSAPGATPSVASSRGRPACWTPNMRRIAGRTNS